MNEIQAPLTEDEAACLMIMKEGVALLALPYSRWEKPIRGMLRRGFVQRQNMKGGGDEYVITDTGRAVCDAWENQSLIDVINVNNKVAESTVPFPVNTVGFSEKQVRALADFYWKMTGRNPVEICPP